MFEILTPYLQALANLGILAFEVFAIYGVTRLVLQGLTSIATKVQKLGED
jgi:hypothetical protein